MFYIPAGCTSKVQFHDVIVNKPFKQAVEQAFCMRSAHDKKVANRENCVNSSVKG